MKADKVGIKEVVLGYQYRIKPNSYLVEGKRVFERLRAHGVLNSTVADYTKSVFRPGIFKRIFVKSEHFGRPYITAQAMVNEDPRRMAKFISTKYTANLDYMSIHKNDILVSCAGTIGNVRLIGGFLDNYIASQDIIRAVADDKYGFVYAYLSTSYVYDYLQAQIYGSVVPRIEPENVRDIPVPSFSQEIVDIVNSLIIKSQNLRDEAISIIDEAKNTLSIVIGDFYIQKGIKTAVVSSQSIFNSLQHRLDPPAIINDGVITMKEIVSSQKTIRLGDIEGVSVYRPGIFKRNYVAKGIPYIKGSEIFLTSPFRKCEHLSKTRTPFIDEMSLYEGQILITCAGSVGEIKMITKEFEDNNAIGSQDIIRLESSNALLTKEYLFIYLQLPFVTDYIQSMKYGSVIERIEPFHIESIPIIIPSEHLSSSISQLVNAYRKKTTEAYKLEEQAIKLLESEIEKWNN